MLSHRGLSKEQFSCYLVSITWTLTLPMLIFMFTPPMVKTLQRESIKGPNQKTIKVRYKHRTGIIYTEEPRGIKTSDKIHLHSLSFSVWSNTRPVLTKTLVYNLTNYFFNLSLIMIKLGLFKGVLVQRLQHDPRFDITGIKQAIKQQLKI